ncbi:MAG: hypothetical protein ACOYJY_01630 [Acutalibacteraceae bacterium]|jgi:hypothetical protein
MNKRMLALTAAVVLCLGMTAGCQPSSPDGGAAGTTAAPTTSAPQTTTAPETTAAPETTTAPETTAAPETEPTIDEEAFEAYFAENPIDAFMDEDPRKEGNMQEMAGWITDLATLWQEEIPFAYERLLALSADGEIPGVKEEKERYLSSREGDVEALQKKYVPVGGSMDAVNRAQISLDYYRGKAKEVYRQIYRHDPEYSYHFSRS